MTNPSDSEGHESDVSYPSHEIIVLTTFALISLLSFFMKKPAYKPQERISKSRAFNASILTALTLFVLILWFLHAKWAIKVMYHRPYGNLLNNLVFGPGTLVADVGISLRVIGRINQSLVEDKIDADHKKYI